MKESNNSINSADFIQSLERGLVVIQAFSKEHPTLTVTEAAKLTSLSRPATRRILLTLEHLGFAISENGHYSLTARVLSLGYSYMSSKNLWEMAEPHMQRLVAKTGESTSISVLDGSDIIYVVRIPTKRIMTISLDVGSRLPAYATSMGQLLLAHLTPEQIEHYFQKTILHKWTEQTITDRKTLKKQLASIKTAGWAFTEEQLEIGLSSVAAPITNHKGEVIAAINISSQAHRIDEQLVKTHLLPDLLRTAKKISEDLSKSHTLSRL